MTPRTFLVDSEPRRAKLLTILAKLPLAKPWEVLVKDYDPKRSTNANARLWKLHTEAGKEAGYSPGELHELMLGEYFGWQQIRTPSGVHEVPRERSHDKTKARFREFMDFVEQRYIQWYGVFLE